MQIAKLETQLLTAEQFIKLDNAKNAELVEGITVPMSRTGFEHGRIEARLTRWLGNFVEDNQLGWYVSGEVGVLIRRDPDSVRSVDLAFVSYKRSPDYPGAKFLQVAPDLVVEIISPNDRWRDLQDKLREYFAIGVEQVWLVDPEIKTVWRYRTPADVELFEVGTETDMLDGEGELTGFAVDLERLFAR